MTDLKDMKDAVVYLLKRDRDREVSFLRRIMRSETDIQRVQHDSNLMIDSVMGCSKVDKKDPPAPPREEVEEVDFASCPKCGEPLVIRSKKPRVSLDQTRAGRHLVYRCKKCGSSTFAWDIRPPYHCCGCGQPMTLFEITVTEKEVC
jgi:predicted RNA-binding Zn-ribbon protein involved in translation (DUF1610 family)